MKVYEQYRALGLVATYRPGDIIDLDGLEAICPDEKALQRLLDLHVIEPVEDSNALSEADLEMEHAYTERILVLEAENEQLRTENQKFSDEITLLKKAAEKSAAVPAPKPAPVPTPAPTPAQVEEPKKPA